MEPKKEVTIVKNHSIELIRIIACLLVIMAHSQLAVTNGSAIIDSRLAFSTFIADDVPLFLLVTGFFFFNKIKKDSDIPKIFPYKIKSFLSRVYIPTIIYILISIIHQYITKANQASSILDADWNYLWRFIFELNPGNHLWYICTYMSFIFFFPMLAFICRDKPKRNKLRRILLGIAIGSAIIADIQYFFNLPMLDIDKRLWGYCTIFLILGYELSLITRKYSNKKKKLLIAGIAFYLVGFILKIAIQHYMFTKYGIINNRFRWLQCSLCFMTASGAFLIIYTLGSKIKNRISTSIIDYVGSCTFAIYLFHTIVISKTGSLREAISTYLGGAKSPFSVTAYYASYALAIFCTTLIISIIFKYTIENPIKHLFNNRKKK